MKGSDGLADLALERGAIPEAENRARVALEVGTHSRWIQQELEALGHQVLVANARKLALIYQGNTKNDRRDARLLARLARADP